MELLDDRSDSECAVIEWCSFIWFGLVGPELTNWLSQKVDTMNNHKNHRKKQTHEHMKNRNPNMPLCFNSRFLVVEALRSRTLPSGPVEHRRSVAQVGLLPAFDDRCVLLLDGRVRRTGRKPQRFGGGPSECLGCLGETVSGQWGVLGSSCSPIEDSLNLFVVLNITGGFCYSWMRLL